MKLGARKNIPLTKRQIKQARIDDFPLCTEVTFEIFEQRYIPRYFNMMSKNLLKKMSPSFIWTEIMSVIKGSISQVYNFQRYLSRREYFNLGSPMLS